MSAFGQTTVSDAYTLAERFQHIQLANISKVKLTKWLRENVRTADGDTLSLGQAFRVSTLIQEAYRMGEIRGRALK